jgi:hypothetical protein
MNGLTSYQKELPLAGQFDYVKPGDSITRMCDGAFLMTLMVTSVDDKFIYCGPPGEGWKFSRESGAEIDEELGWDGITGTGTYLKRAENAQPA